VDYYDGYKIQPTMGADYVSANPRTEQPDAVGGSLKVASFNVLNYFTTLDDGINDICGPDGIQECRGADDANEFTRQQTKIVAAMCAIDADVFGLMELENTNPDNDPDPGDDISNYVLKSLVDALNASGSPCADKTYAFTDSEATGTDAIQQGIIYKTSTVTPLGRAVLDDPSFTDPLDYDDQQTRPAVAQTFMDNATGGVFTVVVNHLKSKSCYDYAKDGDLDLGDGQACFNESRALGAQVLADWLATDPTGSGDGDFLIIGDLNSYDKEDPIDVLLAGGYTDLVHQYQGEYAYSYVFDGQLGYLDHALANSDLLGEVTGTTVWHINADEPDLIDYDTSYKLPAQDALYAPDAYRSSDHDPVIVGLSVCDEIAPTFDEVSVTPDMLWPPNHKYIDVVATVVVSDNFDPDPTITLVSVESDEADFGLDDEDLPNDIVIVDDYTFQLRAERWDEGDGRVYTITYQVTDACGNTSMATVTVTVPHDQRPEK
jgi:predicted extracellular nuclease